MKKQYLFLWFLTLHSALSAFDGFYVGANVGVNATHAEQNGTLFAGVLQGGLVGFPLDVKADHLDIHPDVSFYTGYGFKLCGFYTGLEGFVRYTNPRSSFGISDRFDITLAENTLFSNTLSSETGVKVGPWHYGLDWRGGFLIDCTTLLYGKLGVEWASVHFLTQNRFLRDVLNVQPISRIREEFELSQKKSKAHLRAGFGIEKLINSCWAVRLDYLYTHYGHYHLSQQNLDLLTTPNSIINSDVSIDLNSHALTLGLSYYFNDPNCCTLLKNRCSREFTGFYSGIALGVSILDNRVKGMNAARVDLASDPSVPFSLFLESTGKRHSVDKDSLAYLGLGYSYGWNCLFLGIEGFIQYANHFSHYKHVNNAGTPVLTLSSHHEVEIEPFQVGVSLRPGFFLTPSTVLYGHVGTSYASVKSRAVHILDSDTGEPLLLNSSQKKDKATLRMGFGIEYALCSSWHLRGDYTYTDYGKLRLNANIEEFFLEPPVNQLIEDQSQLDLFSHGLTLGIFKYF